MKSASGSVSARFMAVRNAVTPAIAALSVGAGGLVASGLALAADGDLDVTGITGALASAGTGIGTVGTSMLLVAGAGIAVKWFLGFIFG